MSTVVVVLAISAIGLILLFEREQLRQVDASLSKTADLIERATSPQATSMPPSFLAEAVGDAFVQVVDNHGEIVFATERLAGVAPMRSVGDSDPTEPVTADVAGLGSVRSVAVPFRDNWVLMGTPLRDVEDSVVTLRTTLVVGLPILAVVLGVILWLVVGRSLRPVQSAFDREERLVADVSHELRSPLAGARALLESESRVPAEIELNRIEVLAALSRLDAITEGLLADVTLNQSDPQRRTSLVDVDEVVLGIVERTTVPTGITIDTSEVSGGQVRGREDDLERLVSNLLNNAARHARSRVEFGLVESDGLVTLRVSDDGHGIAPEDRERVFERFTRLDEARSRDRGGAGLGLAIARSVATAHGGVLSVYESSRGGAEFVVTLPDSSS